MVSKLFTVFLALFAAATAFKVPAQTTDGVYIVTVNDNGEEVHSKVGEIDLSDPATKRDGMTGSSHIAKIGKRYNWTSGSYAKCNNDYLWGNNLYNGAYNSFWNQCSSYGSTKITWDSIYSYYQGAVAYMCNYSSSGNPCNVNEWADTVNWVSSQCGVGTDGWKQAGMSS